MEAKGVIFWNGDQKQSRRLEQQATQRLSSPQSSLTQILLLFLPVSAQFLVSSGRDRP